MGSLPCGDDRRRCNLSLEAFRRGRGLWREERRETLGSRESDGTMKELLTAVKKLQGVTPLKGRRQRSRSLRGNSFPPHEACSDQGPLPSGRVRGLKARLGAHLRQRIEVDDVIQETFTKAYQSLARFEWQGEGSFMSWLRKISENVVLRAADREKSEKLFQLERRLGQGIGQGDSEVTASRAVRRGERFERLEKALASLSPDHREAPVLMAKW